jgi:dihydropteroate synthase
MQMAGRKEKFRSKHMIIGTKEFYTDREGYIMGILNVTPDSFSDGGNYNKLDAALFQAEKMIKEGAAIIDIGGESTRPNYTRISDEEEIERVASVIEAVKSRFDTVVSLDTYKSAVAKAGINAGADLINDIWGLKWDGTMADVIAKGGVAACLMHNRKTLEYTNYIEDVMADLKETMDMASCAGIAKDKIMLDPGIGFAKNLDQNRLLMKHLDRLMEFEVPVLLGTSRKSMIGLTLDLPVDQREEGTMATTVMGYLSGCRFFRVHNVEANYRAMKMTEAICNQQ